jgi:1-acyl-sn-glycerol-3-phosphate acyltransferase
MPYLRALGLLLVIVFGVVALAPLQTLARRRGWRLQHSIQTGFCRAAFRAIGLRVSAHGALPDHTPRLVVANHVSWTDIIALASLYPFVFLAKKEVETWPLLGLLARVQGTIFVERETRRDIARASGALARTLNSRRDVVVFPEGTSTDGGDILPFRPGPFEALQKTAEPAVVAPVALRYTDVDGCPVDLGWYGEMSLIDHIRRLLRHNGAICHVRFGEPISAVGSDRKMTAMLAEKQVRALHAE